jgi:GT2 family glycosyltransferase
LFALDYPRKRFEVLIVDAGSIDTTLQIARSYPVSVITEPRKNRGYSRNTAVENSKGDIIAFIDADCVAARNWLKEHVRIHEDPNILVVGGSVVQGGDTSLPATIFHETYFAAQSPNLSRHPTWDLATCNASFKRTTFWQVGLFPEVHRGEDSLLCWQVLKKGYLVIFDPTPQVVHLHGKFGFNTLFNRSREQGEADREIQDAFGLDSPLRLPRGRLSTTVFLPSLAAARFGRYLFEIVHASDKMKAISSFPVLVAISLLWTIGYFGATRSQMKSH